MRYFDFIVLLNIFQYSLQCASLENSEDNATRSSVSYSSVPNYTEIYTKELRINPTNKLNHFSIAHLNSLLSRHGSYEFPPRTYVDITILTSKYGNPIDLAFSQEKREATVSWQKGGCWLCCSGGIKTQVFQTVAFSQPTPQAIQEANKQKTALQMEQITRSSNPLPLREMAPRTSMSQQDAERTLKQNFSRFTEIQSTYYISQNKYPLIVADLMRYGDANFGVKMDENNALFLVLKWCNGERQYMLYSHPSR